MGQQSVGLLERIVKMTTNPENLVLDPFFGSGTSFVAAENCGRAWLGSDMAEDGHEIALARLQQEYSIQPGRDFVAGDDATLALHPILDYGFSKSYRRFALPPLLMTEGKTDWKHLKRAFMEFRRQGLYRDLEIEFWEYEDEIQMGSNELENNCRLYAKSYQPRSLIAIFDRDEPQRLRRVSGIESPIKNWGNNVFSFAIPVPAHREENPAISVELYYHDEDLKRVDEHGRRLYLSREFHPKSGKNLEEPTVNCTLLSPIRSESVSIIDDAVFNAENRNIALPKSDFADYVLKQKSGFDNLDFSAFKAIFDLIEEITECNG
jgi:RNA-directed DNA polymerase